jgi:hypothetical protein
MEQRDALWRAITPEPELRCGICDVPLPECKGHPLLQLLAKLRTVIGAGGAAKE